LEMAWFWDSFAKHSLRLKDNCLVFNLSREVVKIQICPPNHLSFRRRPG